MVSERRRRARPGQRSDEVATAVERLSTLLEAGVAPESAWTYLGDFSHDATIAAISRSIGSGVRPVDAIARVTGRSTGEGRRHSRRRFPSDPRAHAPGAADPLAPWRSIGAAWYVADAAGASLAPSLRQLARAARDRAETEREIELGLAGPRATARLVGWLPVLGLGLGTLMGIDIAGTLLGDPLGWGLLASGTTLAIAGRRWTRALSDRAVPCGDAAGVEFDLVAVALTGGVSVERARALTREAFTLFGVRDRDRDRPRVQGSGTSQSPAPISVSGELESTLSLAERAGAPAVDLLRSSAVQARRDARIDGRQTAATLGVRLMLPLGVCVLPSFMLIGVAPVVLSIVSSTVGAF